MVVGDFGDIDQHGKNGHVVGSEVVRRRLVREGVQGILCKVCRQVFGYIVDVVSVDAWFATCYGDARFGSRAREVWWKV